MLAFQRKYLFLLITLGLLVILGACSDDSKSKEDPEQKSDPNVTQISSYNDERLDDQDEIEEKLISEYEDDTYTLDDPFIKLDPYDVAPLSALLMFETDEPMEIKVTTGLDEVPIVRTWDEAETSHSIPVLGLYPDKDNKVKIEATNEDGETTVSEVTITTEALPDDFMNTTLIESQPDKMEDGMTFVVPTSGYLYAVDENADVRWYFTSRSRMIFTQLENGHYVETTRKDDAKQYNEMLEVDLLGKIYNAYNIEIEGYDENEDNLIHHDVIELPSGNFLATTHEPNSEYVEDHMHEIDRETGETTNEINLRDIMPENAPIDYDGKGADKNDWFHQNAIWYDDDDQSILVSGRSQDVILKMSYPDGKLEWILGADEEWPDDFQDYRLEPKGDVKFPAGQHAMKIVDNPEIADDPNVKDIILFDNNIVLTRGDEDVSEDYSQAIRYRINEEDMTVEETWSYGKDRGEDFFSHIIGNVQYLYGKDNIILNSGATKDEDSPTGTTGRIVEVDATVSEDDPEVVYELEVQGKEEDSVEYTYRTWRFPLYPAGEWDFQLDGEEAE